MTILYLLIPVSILMGVVGLAAFFWSLQARQYDDLEGDATRILHDETDEPLPRKETSR